MQMAAICIILFLTSKAATLLLKFPYKIQHIIRCSMMGRIFLLITLSSLLKRAFLEFQFMDYYATFKLFLSNFPDFRCGFFFFGCFSPFLSVVGLFLILLVGFKLLKFGGHHCKLSVKSSAYLDANDVVDDDGKVIGVKKIESFEGGTTKMECSCGAHKFEEKKEDEEGFCNEDEVFDVMSLRRMVKKLRRKAEAANSELEKERMAASSSVDEAMAMILRLQNEKSALQIRASQLERVADEKQVHDQEVIQSLQWTVMRHESEKSLLQEKLRVCREKLKEFIKDEERDQFDGVCSTPNNDHCSFEMSNGDDGFAGTLDFDSSPL